MVCFFWFRREHRATIPSPLAGEGPTPPRKGEGSW
jgi:hypothetical protein